MTCTTAGCAHCGEAFRRPAIGKPGRTPRVLSIAGTDPSGGAGIHADLKAIAACGGYGMAVVSALTAQNTRGVRAVHVPSLGFLRDQLNAISDDITVDAVKTGMLFDSDIIATVGRWLTAHRPDIIVVDPVMVATSGDRLLRADAEQAMRDLIAQVDLVTPNVPELAVLLNTEPARTWDELEDQARALAADADVLVLAKGGHLDDDTVRDALIGPDGMCCDVTAPRSHATTTHGTGCSLSAAIATLRARYGEWEPALADARAWLTTAIEHGPQLQVGGGHGPVSHFAQLWDEAQETRDRHARRSKK